MAKFLIDKYSFNVRGKLFHDTLALYFIAYIFGQYFS